MGNKCHVTMQFRGLLKGGKVVFVVVVVVVCLFFKRREIRTGKEGGCRGRVGAREKTEDW